MPAYSWGTQRYFTTPAVLKLRSNVRPASAYVSLSKVEPYNVPIEDAYEDFGEEFTVMCEWFNDVGYSASIDGLPDRFGFEFVDFETYLREHGWEDKEESAATPGWLKTFQ